MKLQNKMALCMGSVVLLFAVALAVAIAGMRDATSSFDTFVEQDQAFLGEANNLYAQGLQMGQALRNIVLAPENKTGYKNLTSARADFVKAMGAARSLAGSDAASSAVLEKNRHPA